MLVYNAAPKSRAAIDRLLIFFKKTNNFRSFFPLLAKLVRLKFPLEGQTFQSFLEGPQKSIGVLDIVHLETKFGGEKENSFLPSLNHFTECQEVN